jgi:hypothetical protein
VVIYAVPVVKPAPVVVRTPVPTPRPTSQPPASVDVTPVTQPAGFVAQLSAAGGELAASDLGVVVSVPGESLSGDDATLQIVPVTNQPPANNGFQAGDHAFSISLTGVSSGQPLTQFAAPLSLTYQPSSAELALASGDLSRLSVSSWEGGAWAPVPCSPVAQQLSCTLAHLSTFELMIGPLSTDAADFDLPNGHFFRQTNGFGGAGQMGYGIVDDADAAFWTEFQRLGGLEQVGYPVSGRFTYHGFVTQVFQKLALQWQPELGMAVPINVFDELPGATDTWLNAQRQVPLPTDVSSDLGQPWDQVVANHVALLDAYPALSDFYFASPDPLETYGLPLSVQNYGSMVTVRTQRVTLQLWTVDTPWVSAGTVVVGNGGDLAKEAGVWPSDALTPELPPVGDSPSVAVDR